MLQRQDFKLAKITAEVSSIRLGTIIEKEFNNATIFLGII